MYRNPRRKEEKRGDILHRSSEAAKRPRSTLKSAVDPQKATARKKEKRLLEREIFGQTRLRRGKEPKKRSQKNPIPPKKKKKSKKIIKIASEEGVAAKKRALTNRHRKLDTGNHKKVFHEALGGNNGNILI